MHLKKKEEERERERLPGPDVDYLTGEAVSSEPASSSHEQLRPPQLPFHGPNSPASEETEVEEDDGEELIPDQPDPTPQTLYPRSSTRGWLEVVEVDPQGKTVAVLGGLQVVHAGEAAQE